MEPRDRLRDLIGGADCAVCRRRVPLSSVRLLAERDDLAFVELTCAACGSVALGMVVAIDETGPSPRAVLDGGGRGELLPDEELRLADAPPIGDEDVRAMHDLLATWPGDLRSLLNRRGPGADTAGHGA